MSILSLAERVEQLKIGLRNRIEGLEPNDPAKDGFRLELETLIHDQQSYKNLNDFNALMGALKQLCYLLRSHYIRLRYPQCARPIEDKTASLLTVEARQPQAVLKSVKEMRFSIEPALLHEKACDNQQFDPVSPTAKVVGYLRGLDRSLKITDQLSMETEGGHLMDDLGIIAPDTQASMAVLFQSRYHAINAAITKSDHSAMQVIEFAAGISPRGYQWSQMSPGTIYVESDLPHLMYHKAKLIRNSILASKTPRRGLLHCCAADVLNLESIDQALTSLDMTKPITIVTEGLLLYFNAEEMNQFLTNIQNVLSRNPESVWVTDLVTQENLHELLSSHPGVAAGVRQVFSATGRQVVGSNPFKTNQCIKNYFTKHDLEIESTVALKEVTGNLEFDVEVAQDLREKIVGTRNIWRITGKDKR